MRLVNYGPGEITDRLYNELPQLKAEHRSRHRKIHARVLQHPAHYFWKKVVLIATGCWEWQGWINQHGYPQVRSYGKNIAAHRFVFTLLGFDVPTNRSIDHLCRNRRCVNPDHLEIVPIRVNVLRGTGPSAQNEVKLVCKCGHSLTDATNVYYYPDGRRSCRLCQRAHCRAYRNRRCA